MDSKNEKYEIEFTEECRKEIDEIYEYISEKLRSENSAKRLMKKMRNTVMDLSESPSLYMKIEKKDKLKRDFRRIVIDNFVVLYAVDEICRIVYIVHMYYGRRDYL